MNWKDELMEEMGYTICPICFPEYVHCNNDCEYCEEYIDFKQYYEGNKKVRKEAGRVRVANKNTILWEDVKIIFEDKYIKLFNDLEPDYENNCMKGLTLNDCLRIAKENGYKRGTIMVLSESYLDGDVYRYGNYLDDEWYEIGKLAGFA